MRTIHWLHYKLVVRFLTFDQKQLITEFFPVARGLVEIFFCDVRNPYFLKPARLAQFLRKTVNFLTKYRTFWCEQRKSGAHKIRESKQIKLTAKFTMVAFYGFLAPFQICIEFVFG